MCRVLGLRRFDVGEGEEKRGKREARKVAGTEEKYGVTVERRLVDMICMDLVSSISRTKVCRFSL